MEDGLAGLDERLKGRAFGVFGALLVDRKVDEVEHVGNDVAGVFQAYGYLV